MAERSMVEIAREQAPGLPWREGSDPHTSWEVAEFQAGIVSASAARSPRGGVVVEAEVRGMIVTRVRRGAGRLARARPADVPQDETPREPCLYVESPGQNGAWKGLPEGERLMQFIRKGYSREKS